MSYVHSQETLVLKLGEGEHKGKLFLNKASQEAIDDGMSFSTPPEGMLELAKKLSLPQAANRTMSLIGRGATPVAEVADGLKTGEMFGFQYHGDQYADPKWTITLGFVRDVEAKNAGYGKKRGKKRPVKKARKKTSSLL